MDKPSPVLSRPHSAATTPKIPIRSSLIDKLGSSRKNSRNEHESREKPSEQEETEKHEGEDQFKERADVTKYGTEPISPSKPLLSESVYEERETCCTYKIRNSFILCCGFLCFGASMAIMGPTVLELGCLIGTDVGEMSWVFFSQACSALLGAICSGFIIDR